HFEPEAAGLRARGLRESGRPSSDLQTKIVIAVLLLGGFLAGVVVLFRQGGGQPEEVPPAFPASTTNPGRADARALPRRLAAAAGAVGAINVATGPKPGEAEGSAEARQRAYVENRVAELMELASQDGPASLDIVLSELTNRDPEIRKAALEATLQVRSREAIPRLMEAAEQTDDPREKAAIADAIEFLKLPTLAEVTDQMAERATNAPPEPAGRAGNR
ncbi:MAG: HEAT repeat domain-containing protein, partial [Verrucomicrobiota bacterium]